MATSYAQVAKQYAEDVVAGKIPNCKWVKLAAQRHLNDLARQDAEDFPYRFDDAKAKRACAYIEKLPHVKGRWAAKKQKLKLQPWQVFIVANLFGWLEKLTGYRRYRQAYVCVPRKNGKSPLAAGIGLYMLSADGEHGAEVYCGATNEKQAWEVFRPAHQMVERTPEMQEQLGITINAKSLVITSNGSRFEPVIGKPGDGASPSCGICDEFHEAPTADLFDTFARGMVGREQPLLLVITTAGTDISSPCYDYQQQAQKVLEGTFDYEAMFAIIFTVDEGDDWTSEEALHKANPNLGVSISLKTLKDDQKVAVQNSAKQNEFKTKHLNVWCNASVAWMNMVSWNACGDAKLAEFAGQDCHIGLDLAAKIDLAADVKIFRKEIDGKLHYFSFSRFYLPEDRAQDPQCQHYQKWANDGYLITTPGNVIDFGTILTDLVDDTKKYHVLELDFDQWSAEYLRQQFAEKTGVPTIQVPQSPQYLSDPAKEFEALVLSGRWHHDGNPVMTWCVSNVVAKYNSHDNLVLDKDKVEHKIDGVDALLNALYRALAAPLQPKLMKYQRIQFI
jgi:phage terminase large subunit-like protein